MATDTHAGQSGHKAAPPPASKGGESEAAGAASAREDDRYESGSHRGTDAEATLDRRSAAAAVPPVRDRLAFSLPDAALAELTAPMRGLRRRLTQITPPKTGTLDPVVIAALQELANAYRDSGEKAHDELSTRYLSEAEAVTERLNRQGLPRTTRLLLSIPAVYETLLYRAIKDGVGARQRSAESVVHGAGSVPQATARTKSRGAENA